MTAALLHCHEIPLAELVPAHGEDDAAAFAAGGGVPVVLKADVPGLVHKTDADGVELDLRNEAEVAALFRIDVEVAELAAAHVADRVRCVDLVPPGERRKQGRPRQRAGGFRMEEDHRRRCRIPARDHMGLAVPGWGEEGRGPATGTVSPRRWTSGQRGWPPCGRRGRLCRPNGPDGEGQARGQAR